MSAIITEVPASEYEITSGYDILLMLKYEQITKEKAREKAMSLKGIKQKDVAELADRGVLTLADVKQLYGIQ